ncbi:MAG: hypothetical protein ACRDY1_10230 [Acidimicrobiales bacterium]
MEPENLSPAEVTEIKDHLRAMTEAVIAAQASDDPVEAEERWAEYRRHQAVVERLLPPEDSD